MKKLNAILKNITLNKVIGSTDKSVKSISFDSRTVELNTLFVANKGTHVDGHTYIDLAISKGATSIICEVLPIELNPSVTYIQVEDSTKILGLIASEFYGNPSSKLKLVGITGTNGKTTTVTLLYKLFKDLGYKVGLLSTVRNYIHNTEINATHTTPDAVQLNNLLAQMVEEGCDYCFMEVSSHSIVQNRIAGLTFVGGIFSNITHDHLDYHHTFQEYLDAKKLFFDGLTKNAFALTNLDDKRGEYILQNTKASKHSYGLQSFADFKAKILENSFAGLFLNLDGQEFSCKLIGRFNAYNILAIYATAILLDQDKEEVLRVLSNLSSVDGRFEYQVSENKIIGIVDYAHTPDALENVLNTINDIRDGNETLITVVGCGGDRDRTKRPIMAAIACEKSTRVIITSDNPRSEEPEAIIDEMKKGIETKYLRKVLSITDRAEAIKTAVSIAQSGDIILIAGKGHETYQDIKGVKHHFDDKEMLAENFKLFNN